MNINMNINNIDMISKYIPPIVVTLKKERTNDNPLGNTIPTTSPRLIPIIMIKILNINPGHVLDCNLPARNKSFLISRISPKSSPCVNELNSSGFSGLGRIRAFEFGLLMAQFKRLWYRVCSQSIIKSRRCKGANLKHVKNHM